VQNYIVRKIEKKYKNKNAIFLHFFSRYLIFETGDDDMIFKFLLC